MKKSLLLFSFLMSLTISSFAQLSWSKQKHDFGTSQENVPMAYEFKCMNYSTKDVTINFMKISSNRLIPNWTKEVIKPDEQGTILLTYTPNSQGRYSETLEIFLDNNPYAQKLFITGVVGDGDFNNMNQPTLVNKLEKDNSNLLQKQNLISLPSVAEVSPKKLTESAVPTSPKKMTVPNRPTKMTTTAPTENIGRLETVIFPEYIGGANLNTAANATYLTDREKMMIKEINLVRSNPETYIKVVEAYIRYMEADNLNVDSYGTEIKTAKELIEVLNKTPRLSILKPSRGIYEAAKKHGQEAKSIGSLDHKAQDGSWPSDRIKSFDSNMSDGTENIVGGLSDIRKSVLILLVDSGIRNRGHRVALLYPDWTHIACYEVGKVGDMPYMWLQNFGQAKTNPAVHAPTKPQLSITQAPKVSSSVTDAKPPHNLGVRTKPKKIEKTNPNNGTTNNPEKPKKESNSEGLPSTYDIPNTTPIGRRPMPTKPLPTSSNSNDNTPTKSVGTNNLAATITPSKKAYTAKNATYMSSKEQEMIAEINFLRMDPKRYSKVIEAYIDFMEMEISKDKSAEIFFNKELKSARELLKLLNRLQPLNRLKPHQGMYKAAKIHGQYGKSSGNLEKQGSDGSMPHNRILKYADDMMDGDENLPNGTPNIRYSIIKLLIDKDDYNRTQRKILLNPNWDYCAIYEVGKVGNMHYWVQDFGQARPESKPMFDTENGVKDAKNHLTFGYAQTKTFTETLISAEIQPSNNTLNITNVSYLSIREQMLLREINFLRLNPKEYAKIIGFYIKTLEEEKIHHPNEIMDYNEKIEAAKFIKDQLMKTNSLGILKSNQNIYKAAYQHGQDCKRNRSLTHWGSDGANTWQRLQKAIPTIKDGDQCLVSGTDDVRESIINILVNHAIYSSNREIALLKSNWTIFGAAEIGEVGKRTDCWIITIGEE